jgi:hypothetical protein
MEVWQAIFGNLYSGFLLRDFAGKIVPGVLLLFSICCLYREPKKLFEFLAKDVPTFTLVFVAGFAWILTLGTQSLAEGLGICKKSTGCLNRDSYWHLAERLLRGAL